MIITTEEREIESYNRHRKEGLTTRDAGLEQRKDRGKQTVEVPGSDAQLVVLALNVVSTCVAEQIHVGEATFT